MYRDHVAYILISTSNHNVKHSDSTFLNRCLYSYFYIKPQLFAVLVYNVVSCLYSYFYIKPQRRALWIQALYVAYILISTSNHNWKLFLSIYLRLLIFLFLHQTTTHLNLMQHDFQLLIFLFLHQTTTEDWYILFSKGCLYSYFYIKPQQDKYISTKRNCCLYSYFYIKPQPFRTSNIFYLSCLYSYFYIKPQLAFRG